MKNKKTLIVIIVVILIVVGIIVYKKWEKSKEDKSDKDKSDKDNSGSSGTGFSGVPANQTTATTSVFKSLPTGSLPLKKGDKNKLVYLLQWSLNKVNNKGLAVDGAFGDNTKAALKAAYGVETVDTAIAQKIYQATYQKAQNDSSLATLLDSFNSYMKFS
jgi:hypothetical protein